MVDPGLS